MNVQPKNPIGLCYALTSRLNDALFWISSPEYVKENEVNIKGLLNKLFNEVQYIDGLLTAVNSRNTHLVSKMSRLLAEYQTNQSEPTPWPECQE